MVVKSNKSLFGIFLILILALSYAFLSTKLFLGLFILLIGGFFVLYDIKIGLCGLALFYPFLPDMVNLLAFLALGFLIFVRKIIYNKEDFKVTKFGLPLFLFFIYSLINTFTSVNIMGSIRDLALNTAGLFFVFAMVNSLEKKENLNVFVSLLLVGALLAGLVGIRQIFTGVTMRPEWTDVENSQNIAVRVYSVFTNPNIFAEYLVLMIPLGVGLMWQTKNMKKKFAFLFALGVLFLALLMTMSRGGWLGIFCAALVFILVVDKRLLLLGIPAFILLILFLPDSILNRFLSIGSSVDSSILYRLKMYGITFQVIRDNFINGVGFGYIPFKQTFESYIRTMPIYHAHNTFLEIFAEGGIIGITIFLGLVISLIKNAYAHLCKSSDKYIKYLGAGALASIFGILANGMTEHILYMPRIIFSFWILAGIILSLIRIEIKSEREVSNNILRKETITSLRENDESI